MKVNRDPLPPKLYPNISSTLVHSCIYVGVVLNSFFSKRPFLAKKNTFAKLSPFPQKSFAEPYVGFYLEISGRKQELDKGHLRI